MSKITHDRLAAHPEDYNPEREKVESGCSPEAVRGLIAALHLCEKWFAGVSAPAFADKEIIALTVSNMQATAHAALKEIDEVAK